MADKKRLIYAEDALVGLQYISMFGDVNDTMIQGAMRLARSKIENAPTVDAVEVVRCKDCVNRSSNLCPMETVELYPWFATKNDAFCSYGERKQDGK